MKSEWKNIKDSLPIEGKKILVYNEDIKESRIMSAQYEDNNDQFINWFDENGYYDDSDPNITHWMELPNRPNK